MPLFGSKKKKKEENPEADIEAAEEDGLFMARNSDEPDAASDSASPEDGEDNESDLSVPDLQPEADSAEGALEGEAQESLVPEGAPAGDAAAATESSGVSAVDDLMSAFEDDESQGDLKELTKDLEDVPMAELLAELRSIRTTLPPEALEHGEDVA